jgi:hypothetical protein
VTVQTFYADVPVRLVREDYGHPPGFAAFNGDGIVFDSSLSFAARLRVDTPQQGERE